MRLQDNSYIYLASPYSHVDSDIRLARYHLVLGVTRELIFNNHIVYSPIVHNHPIVEQHTPLGWDYWEDFDTCFIQSASMLLVLCIDGWKESQGVQAEIEIAISLDIPIRYITLANPTTFLLTPP